MKKTILFATALMMASCSIPYDSYDRAIVICPRSEEQFVTLMSADTTTTDGDSVVIRYWIN